MKKTTLLLETRKGTDMLTSDEADKMISEIEAKGYTVTTEYTNRTAEIYKYEFSMDLLEAQMGSYYTWSVENKHRLDQIMVDCGVLSYCHNLLPTADEIKQEDAIALAMTEIQNSYGVTATEQTDDVSIQVSYYLSESSYSMGMWRFGIRLHEDYFFEVDVAGGQVTRCERKMMTNEI